MKKACPLFLLLGILTGCGSGSTISGYVYSHDGVVAPFAPVKLIAVDDTGTEIFTAAETVADGHGHYSLSADLPLASTLVLETPLSSGEVRGFAVGQGGNAPIHPFTNEFLAAVIDITGPSGGRTLADFSPEDLRTLTREAMTIDPTSVDFSDEAAVKQKVLDKIGRQLAVASGATLSGVTSASVQPSGTLVSDIVMGTPSPYCAGDKNYLLSSSDFTFDITSQGKICDGYSSMLNNAFNNFPNNAQITNDTFIDSGTSDYPENLNGYGEPIISIFADHTAVLMAKTTQNGLTLQRKIYVPASGNWARYLEILKNTGSSTARADFRVVGEVGTSITTFMLVRGENDPATLSATDRFAASTGNFAQFPKPTVGYVWQDNNGISASTLQFAEAGNADNFLMAWNGLQLAAGQTKTILYYYYLTANREAAAVRQALKDIADSPDMSQMYTEELAALQNFAPTLGNIVGQAGAVVEGATVTATNSRSGASVSGKARQDWSFYLSLEAVSGDVIALTATDGLSTSVTVP